MSQHQIVDMRRGAPRFGDDITRARWEALARKQCAESPFQFSVAPWQRIKTDDGRILIQGEEVKRSDFTNWRDLDRLVGTGCVLVSDTIGDEPQGAA